MKISERYLSLIHNVLFVRRLSVISIVLILSGCSVHEISNDQVLAEKEYEIPKLEYDSPSEGNRMPFTPIGFGFSERAIGDSLTLEERIHIDNIETSHLKISSSDSIHISYLTVGNYCGFFEGKYKFENDTIFIWHHEDAYDGCGENCLFVLDYTLPKPHGEKVVISINREVRTLDLR